MSGVLGEDRTFWFQSKPLNYALANWTFFSFMLKIELFLIFFPQPFFQNILELVTILINLSNYYQIILVKIVNVLYVKHNPGAAWQKFMFLCAYMCLQYIHVYLYCDQFTFYSCVYNYDFALILSVCMQCYVLLFCLVYFNLCHI